MSPVILVALAAIGQSWGTSSCSPVRVAPSYQPSVQLPVVINQPVRVLDNPAQRQSHDWYRIKHDGLSFTVWGTRTANGKIEWDADLPVNAERYRQATLKAEAEKKAKADEAASQETRKPAVTNYGIDPARLTKGKPRYTANSLEAEHFIRETQQRSEHKDRCYVTVIGNPADRKPVAEDWNRHPAFDGLRDNVWFQEFKKGEWQVRDELGYKADGKPTILVQKPDGEVLLRLNSYNGPHPIANALRKADPHYKPENDPTQGGGADEILGGNTRTYIAVGAIFLVALFFVPRRQK